ncbi:MAG: hypothetical protein LUI39_02895 [Lachnospiraceae bacterium]|nr:hypothetical protein [Lachnospiraceae bacterium]
MAKKNNGSADKKTILVIFIEGDTEVDFYNKMVASIREKVGQPSCTVKIKNVKGVGNYQNRACRIFENGIKKKYPGYRYVVALCYDTDVFLYSRKPPVDWDAVTKALKEKGADQVNLVRAEKSIEDWFLFDMDGLRRFLKISLKTKLPAYKGQKGLEQLFLKANKTYIKGVQCKGLVDALDMEKIFPHICREIRTICNTMGVNCSTDNERCNG